MKANIFELECDLDTPDTDDLALLMFHSVAPSYAFVNDINRLYDFSLHRIDDMVFDEGGTPWPLFVHYNSLNRLHCYMSERPASSESSAPFWTAGHKLLILRGPTAADTAEAIHRDFASAAEQPDPSDILAIDHRTILDSIRADFTTTTPIAPDCNPPAALKGKALRDYRELYDLIYTILDYIDINLISSN